MGELSGGLSGMGVPQVGQAPQQISGLPQAGALSNLAGSAPDTAPTYDPTVRPLPNLQDAPVGALGTAPDVMSQQLQAAPAPQVAPEQPQLGLAEFGGRTLSQYLTDPTVEGAGLMTDAQGRMIDPTVDRSAFEAASAARSAAAGPNLQSIGGAPRPGVDVPSLAMQRSRMEAGLDPVAGAPTGMSQQQQRDQLERGVDPATGRAISRDSLTPQDAANVRKTEAETAKILSEIDKGGQTSEWSDGRKQAMKTQAKELAEWEINELPKQQDNMRQLGEAANLLEQGQIETGTFGEQVPVLGEWARPFLNPDAEVAQQQIAGVIMQSLKETFPGAISNEERKALISTVYNPRLKPAENADLVRGYMRRLDAALKAKTAQSQHFRKFGNLEGYSGTTPRDALMSGVSGGTGGSPIEGDVNVASAADDILAQQ